MEGSVLLHFVRINPFIVCKMCLRNAAVCWVGMLRHQDVYVNTVLMTRKPYDIVHSSLKASAYWNNLL